MVASTTTTLTPCYYVEGRASRQGCATDVDVKVTRLIEAADDRVSRRSPRGPAEAEPSAIPPA